MDTDITRENMKSLLPRRQADAHKGDFGHVLVIGGDCGMAGAVQMAATAAARTGAGLVSVATRADHADIITVKRPEIMCHGVEKGVGLVPLIARANALVVGPGIGQSDWAKDLFAVALESDLPKVIDADALNLLAYQPVKNENWVLTPHPGEAGRLLHIDTEAVQGNRTDSISLLQKHFGGIVVLKGRGTLIKGVDPRVYRCAAGNPGMASGGMGDILSGMIGSFIAQGLGLMDATQLGVWLHSTAADRLVVKSGERGLLALDVVDEARALINEMLVE